MLALSHREKITLVVTLAVLVVGAVVGFAFLAKNKATADASAAAAVPCPRGENGVQCSGNGTCANGTCDCNQGWSGKACNVTGGPCPMAKDPKTGHMLQCSGHGTCTNGTCACEASHHGADCSRKLNTCYTGLDPNTQKLAPCSGSSRGTCNGGTCSCLAGFTGLACDHPITCPKDGDGNVCGGHGTCDAETGQCHCNSSRFGAACTATSASACPDDCSGHGTCDTANATCACDFGYFGIACDLEAPKNPTTHHFCSSYNAKGELAAPKEHGAPEYNPATGEAVCRCRNGYGFAGAQGGNDYCGGCATGFGPPDAQQDPDKHAPMDAAEMAAHPVYTSSEMEAMGRTAAQVTRETHLRLGDRPSYEAVVDAPVQHADESYEGVCAMQCPGSATVTNDQGDKVQVTCNGNGTCQTGGNCACLQKFAEDQISFCPMGGPTACSQAISTQRPMGATPADGATTMPRPGDADDQFYGPIPCPGYIPDSGKYAPSSVPPQQLPLQFCFSKGFCNQNNFCGECSCFGGVETDGSRIEHFKGFTREEAQDAVKACQFCEMGVYEPYGEANLPAGGAYHLDSVIDNRSMDGSTLVTPFDWGPCLLCAFPDRATGKCLDPCTSEVLDENGKAKNPAIQMPSYITQSSEGLKDFGTPSLCHTAGGPVNGDPVCNRTLLFTQGQVTAKGSTDPSQPMSSSTTAQLKSQVDAINQGAYLPCNCRFDALDGSPFNWQCDPSKGNCCLAKSQNQLALGLYGSDDPYASYHCGAFGRNGLDAHLRTKDPANQLPKLALDGHGCGSWDLTAKGAQLLTCTASDEDKMRAASAYDLSLLFYCTCGEGYTDYQADHKPTASTACQTCASSTKHPTRNYQRVKEKYWTQSNIDSQTPNGCCVPKCHQCGDEWDTCGAHCHPEIFQDGGVVNTAITCGRSHTCSETGATYCGDYAPDGDNLFMCSSSGCCYVGNYTHSFTGFFHGCYWQNCGVDGEPLKQLYYNTCTHIHDNFPQDNGGDIWFLE